MFFTADPKDIIDGKITDVYFERALRILKAKGVNPLVKAEFIAKSLPEEWPWALFTGIDEAIPLMKHLNIRVRAMKEGTVFYPYEPVMEIEGRYQDFCVYETAILGLLCQASGVATKASRLKKLAGERPVMSFGARRMHPILAPMIERNAYIGGCDGVSVVKSGELIGEDPMGTMPHALILCMGSTVAAVKAYDEVLEPKFKRVALIDTFLDEKFECLNVAEALGERLFAVRFDTPGSRRGNFFRILQEARWELDLRGHQHVKLYVSGGIKENDISGLNEVVDGYGIGTSISNAPVIDYAMDIVEIDGTPLAKRGKWSGSKRVLACSRCRERRIVPLENSTESACSCGGEMTDLMVPVLDNGKRLIEAEPPATVRAFTRAQVEGLELTV
ncbi:MAG: nicotinate phosphoribosyltransferase [Nitrospirae bacterium GWC2_57_13]|nr:MAG: nicotinate phosphoribosyltransferase [Nitrospirae bacterium GWC2_57_13]OGW42662.1 MAG: nicotinate phosphoribosyltransferase [Nitrospirae bacterium GWD2_57_8]HAS54887.1 nicotinate phosphoribosyltransferase [Nitrospiraceae bacterium]